MKWFLALALFNEDPKIAENLAAAQLYTTQVDCLTDAAARIAALYSVGIHGRFFCMRQKMPDAEIARLPIGEF